MAEGGAKAESRRIAVGIDLGTSFSAISVFDLETKKTKLLDDEKGRTTTPSVVAFTSTGRLVGHSALKQIGSNPGNTITEAKRLMGRKFQEDCVQEDMKRWAFDVVDKDGLPRLKVEHLKEERKYRPEQMSAMLLMHLKTIACDHLKFRAFDQLDAVLTVPVNFGDSHRLAVKEACHIAGVNCLQIITEPAAAAIAYAMEEEQGVKGNILVFDIGGSTTDVSILKLGADNQFEVLACAGDNRLGGEDFDTVLVKQCKDHIFEEYKVFIDTDYSATARLRRICEQAKCVLSSRPSTIIELDELQVCETTVSFRYQIARDTFEALCDQIFDRAVKLVYLCLEQAEMRPSGLSKIVLAGGSTRIPRIKQKLEEAMSGVPIIASLVQDEIVARGAALQAAQATGNLVLNFKLSEILPQSLGINVVGGLTVKILKKNTPVPTTGLEVFRTAYDDQTTMLFKIFEGDDPRSDKNKLLGNMFLENIRVASKGMVAANVTFEINEIGMLRVSAVEQGTNNHIEVSIERYKKELSKEKLDVVHEKAEAEMVYNLFGRLQDQLGFLKIRATECEELSEEQKNVIAKECNNLRAWLEENKRPNKQDFTQKLDELRNSLGFCCTITTAGKITYKN